MGDEELTETREMKRLTDSQRRHHLLCDIFQRDPDDARLEVMRRLRRTEVDPLRLAAELIVTRSEIDHWRSEESKERERDRRLLDALNQPPNGAMTQLRLDFDRLDTIVAENQSTLRPIRRFANWALGVAVTAAMALGLFLYARGGHDTRLDIEIDRLKQERQQERQERQELQQQVRQLERQLFRLTKGIEP